MFMFSYLNAQTPLLNRALSLSDRVFSFFLQLHGSAAQVDAFDLCVCLFGLRGWWKNVLEDLYCHFIGSFIASSASQSSCEPTHQGFGAKVTVLSL
jgi:hypothetical protein